jgi:hypothetical protein
MTKNLLHLVAEPAQVLQGIYINLKPSSLL